MVTQSLNALPASPRGMMRSSMYTAPTQFPPRPEPQLSHLRVTSDTSGASRMISSNTTVGPQVQNLLQQQEPSQPFCKRLSLDSRTNTNLKQQTDYGLLITLHKQPDGKSSRCELSFTPDAHCTDIHPNAYAPAALSHVRKLGGGGSGVAVFEGRHPTLGDLVMKHGGDKDLKELFALATIAEELKERGQHKNDTTGTSATAAAHQLQSRIPEFRMIYISPHHLGEKRRELWYRLSHMYKYSSRNLLVLQEQEDAMDNNNINNMDMDCSMPKVTEEEPQDNNNDDEPTIENATPLKTRRQRAMLPHVPSRNGLNMTHSGTVSGHRDIAIYSTTVNTQQDGACGVELLGDSLTLSIPPCEDKEMGDGLMESIVIPGDGYAALKMIAADLNKLMKEHKWKFTLGQKRIGGQNPQTGNQWLYAGRLDGRLLDNLIRQKIQLVKDLVQLTTEEEKSPKHLRAVQEEVVRFEEEEDISDGDISAMSDSFVGNAIKKNFQHDKGRLPVMTQLGRQFRYFSLQHPAFQRMSSGSDSSDNSSREAANMTQEDNLVLLMEEEIPAHHLGNLLRSGALMGDSFEKTPLEPTILEMNRYYWRTVLRAAIKPRRSDCKVKTPMAMTRLWTCGLTDAGVHNLFLTEDSLWLFDLGQPQLYSAPGFLTKFLFSFFHTLGMEETPDGGWVRRFEHNEDTNKLRMTPETEKLLAKAYDAFEITLDRMIAELFDGDDSLRWLLLQYVTLQLISDASFCLQRWTIKGGGRPRDANHQTGIEKWLWRAIWDMYVAFDINTNETWTRLYVEHPSHRDSMFFAAMRDLMGDAEEVAGLDKESKEEN